MKPASRSPPRVRRSKAILLAAQPTEEPAESSGGLDQTQEAVISLARAVFSRDGTLVLAGATPLLPLILTVATDYWELEITLDDHVDTPRAPLVQVFAARGEEMDGWWQSSGIVRMENDRLLPTDVLSVVIEHARPLAMICLGGEGQVYEQAVNFRSKAPQTPVFVVASIGGDAERIEVTLGAKAADRILMERLDEVWRIQRSALRGESGVPPGYQEGVVPYPLLMQDIVSQGGDQLGVDCLMARL